MGHRIDPYNYNKFTELELDYVLENAKIASEYLNILSGKQESEKLASMAKENEELRGRVSKLEGQFETLTKAKFTK
jgi:cell division protein FtsB